MSARIRYVGALLVLTAGCMESRPGVYVRGASSNWFGNEAAIEGQIETNHGHEIEVAVAVTGEGDLVHMDSTDRDGRYMVRDLKPGKHVVHFIMPGQERHIEVDLQPARTVKIDAVVDEDRMASCCMGGLANPSHPRRVVPVVPESCIPLPVFVGTWQEVPSLDAQRRRAQSIRMAFFSDGTYQGGFLIAGVLPGRMNGNWCARGRSLFVLLQLHELRVADTTYELQGDMLEYKSDEGSLRLKRTAE